MPFLEAGGRINVLEWREVTADALYISPKIIENELYELCRCKWLTHGEYDGPLVQWTGERCIIPRFGYPDSPSAAVKSAIELWRSSVSKSHTFAAVRFLHPPCEGDPPLLQKIWLKTRVQEERPEIETVLERTIKNPTLLNPVERELLNGTLSKVGYHLPPFVEFLQPFEQFFAYGNEMLNLKHPVTQALLRFGASLTLSKMRKTIPEDCIGNLQDVSWKFLLELPDGDYSDPLQRLWLLAQKAQLFDVGELNDLVLTPDDFVPIPLDLDSCGCERMVHHVNSPSFGKPYNVIY